MIITIQEEPKVVYTQVITGVYFKFGSHSYELMYYEDTNGNTFKLYNELGEEIVEGALYEKILEIDISKLIQSKSKNINLDKFING